MCMPMLGSSLITGALGLVGQGVGAYQQNKAIEASMDSVRQNQILQQNQIANRELQVKQGNVVEEFNRKRQYLREVGTMKARAAQDSTLGSVSVQKQQSVAGANLTTDLSILKGNLGNQILASRTSLEANRISSENRIESLQAQGSRGPSLFDIASVGMSSLASGLVLQDQVNKNIGQSSSLAFLRST